MFNIMLVGGLLNYYAIAENQGKMPIYSNYNYESETHFTFQDKSEVKMFYLVDIFKLSFLYFSIGDIIIVLAGGLGIYSAVGFIRHRKVNTNFYKEY